MFSSRLVIHRWYGKYSEWMAWKNLNADFTYRINCINATLPTSRWLVSVLTSNKFFRVVFCSHVSHFLKMPRVKKLKLNCDVSLIFSFHANIVIYLNIFDYLATIDWLLNMKLPFSAWCNDEDYFRILRNWIAYQFSKRVYLL